MKTKKENAADAKAARKASGLSKREQFKELRKSQKK